MIYYRKDNNDIDKFIIDTINNISTEIESLDKRISNLENGNNNNVVNNNNEKYFYMIKEFQIPYEDYKLLNKSYDYFKEDSRINIRFSSDFSSYETLPKDVRFRTQILDDDEIVYTRDQNDKMKYNGDYTFDINFNIDKDIKNPVIKFFILKDYIDYFVPGEIFLNGYYFRDCELYINFLKLISCGLLIKLFIMYRLSLKLPISSFNCS